MQLDSKVAIGTKIKRSKPQNGTKKSPLRKEFSIDYKLAYVYNNIIRTRSIVNCNACA